MIISKNLDTCVQCPICLKFHEWQVARGRLSLIASCSSDSGDEHFFSSADELGIIEVRITFYPFVITIENELKYSYVVIKDNRHMIPAFHRILFKEEKAFEKENNIFYDFLNDATFNQNWINRLCKVVNKFTLQDEIEYF